MATHKFPFGERTSLGRPRATRGVPHEMPNKLSWRQMPPSRDATFDVTEVQRECD